MNNSNNNLINAFSKNTLSNFILIGTNIFNIWGNRIIEKYFCLKDRNYLYLGKRIFVISLIISLVVYIFFTDNNYKNIIKLKNENKEITASAVRYIGSLLLVFGILCFIYYQVNEDELTSGPET